ncbi:Uncharacterized protein TPAR_00673 [Tolypocladium paradoxum]|uniref:Zn(2)-C6 fungal-type domain-containing protein n=1 Tax=Tolypocladium paradoxum TaxID=94208 RepID=A0A2S4L9K8_9HYPO|nr:Uncharacterized protein TPAR_00673 [Tolypocladium paradoxum]
MAPPHHPHAQTGHVRLDGPAITAPSGPDSSSAPSVSPTVEAGVIFDRPEPSRDAAAGSRKRPAARGTAFYPRQRNLRACQVCRSRKTKCDSKRPSCSYCVSVGAVCVQSSFDLSSFDPASLKILDRLDDLERLLRVSPPGPGLLAEPSPVAPSLLPQPLPASRTGSVGGYVVGQLPQYQHVDPQTGDEDCGLSSGSQHPHGSADVPLLSLLPQRIDNILQWPVFRNHLHHHPSPVRLPPDAIPSPAASSLAAVVDMESHRIYRLLDNFFLYVHCKNPILDEPSARRMVMRAFLDGIDWSPASCLALIVCALGSIASPFGPSPTRLDTQLFADSHVFFNAAQKRIGVLLIRSDIIGAQCLFLSGVYMMMVFQPIYGWRFFSQALAACQHFPFLTRAQQNPSLSPGGGMQMGRQDTQEQAVYWSAWKSERELRSELSLPDFDILHSGSTLYPPFFPAPPVPPPESPDGPGSETQRSRASWLFYLAEISLRRLTSRLCSEVLTLRQRYPSDATFLDVLADMTREYEAQAREWSDSLPAELSIHTPIDEDGICRSVLRGRFINLFEMIYWPFVMAALSHAQGRHAHQHLLKKGLDTHMLQVRANEPGFYHRHHGSFFMIRSCTRSALVLVAAARTGCAAMPPAWDEAVAKVAGMLAYWEDEDRSLSGWKATLERELAARRDEQ